MSDVLFLHPVALDSRAAGWLGIDAIAPSLPGHGGRGRARPGMTLDDIADEVVGWTSGPLHVVGASMGGMVAMHLALRHPERVASLALAFTTARVTAAGMLARADDTERMGSAAMAQPTLERWFSPEALAEREPSAGLRYARERLEATPASAIADAWRAIAQHDVLDDLRGIRIPTTCIAGRHDRSTPLEAMQATAKAIPGAELVVLDEPHMGFLEKPEEFSGVLRRHIDRVKGDTNG